MAKSLWHFCPLTPPFPPAVCHTGMSPFLEEVSRCSAHLIRPNVRPLILRSTLMTTHGPDLLLTDRDRVEMLNFRHFWLSLCVARAANPRRTQRASCSRRR